MYILQIQKENAYCQPLFYVHYIVLHDFYSINNFPYSLTSPLRLGVNFVIVAYGIKITRQLKKRYLIEYIMREFKETVNIEKERVSGYTITWDASS